MTRSDHQWELLQALALLILYADRLGYKLTGGELWRPRGSHRHQHYKRLAIDLNLFIRGASGRRVYQRSTEAHSELGLFWESLSPYNRWGGHFRDANGNRDGNHYERLEVSREDAPERWILPDRRA